MKYFLSLKNKKNKFIFNALKKRANKIEVSNEVVTHVSPPTDIVDGFTLAADIKTISHRFTFGSSMGLKVNVDFAVVEIMTTELDIGSDFKCSVNSRKFYGLSKKDLLLCIKKELPWINLTNRPKVISSTRTNPVLT